MAFLFVLLIFTLFISKYTAGAEVIYTNNFNFRVEPGGRTCFFQAGKAGQMMEVYYQVLDGQHGDLDISLDVIDPEGNKIVSDYKKSENAVIKDLDLNGDYSFCLDNTFSIMNSKLVFVYVTIENQESMNDQEVEPEVTVSDSEENNVKEVKVLHWTGTDDSDEPYYIPVESIANSMTRTLKHVVKARHMLDLYAAGKSRDAYVAFEETFVVDMWSGFQICCMCAVGLVQVYMIKKLFKNPKHY